MKPRVIEFSYGSQVCGAGRANSIKHRSPTGRLALRWPRKRNHRILGRPDPASSRRRNCLKCCKCCKIKVVRLGSRNSICSQLLLSSNETGDTLESRFHSKGIRRFRPFVTCLLPLEICPELLECRIFIKICKPQFSEIRAHSKVAY